MGKSQFRRFDWAVIPLLLLAAHAGMKVVEGIRFMQFKFSGQWWYGFAPLIWALLASFCFLYIYRTMRRQPIPRFARRSAVFLSAVAVLYLVLMALSAAFWQSGVGWLFYYAVIPFSNIYSLFFYAVLSGFSIISILRQR